MNFSISIASNVFPATEDCARFAICPMTVLSPVFITIPTPVPEVHDVPKKQTFFVSNMF